MVVTVQPKDTLYSIARKYGVSVDVIKSANNLFTENLFIGQQLRLELPSPITSTASVPVSSSASGLGVFGIQSSNKGSYNQYVVSYPTPTGVDTSNPMRDNYPSPNIVNSRGVSYTGKSTFDSKKDWFSDLCQQSFYLDVLKYISKNEGCFDAVNSYDKSIFSFGFIQFTGAMASGSVLSKVLFRFKTRDQYAFTDTFGKYGIDVQNGNPSPILLFKAENGSLFQGDDAWRQIATDLRLTTMFIASGFRKSMVRAQIEIALENYIYPAVGEKANISFGGSLVSLNNVLRTQMGFALRIDLAVNRGLTGSLQALQPVIQQVANESGINSIGELANIDERRVVQVLAQNDGMGTPKSNRILGVLNAGFGFAK